MATDLMQEVPRIRSVALVVGVTGMAGLSLAEALKKPTALGGPWEVYGGARRPMPTWFPPAAIDHYITFDAIDYGDTVQKLYPLSHQVTHLFWVALQVRATEEANVAVNTAMLSHVLKALLASTPNPSLRHVTLQTGTQQYMGPIHDPALAAHLPRPDPPFREDSTRLPFPNFYYSLEDLLASYSPPLTYSVHRASIIVGASTRSFYNCLLTLSVYAAICKEEATPFLYPGTQFSWDHFWDMTDARVLAEQQIWAAVTEAAKNQTFNCTNGDVFTWKRMWILLSEIFGVKFVPLEEDQKPDLVEEMKKKAGVWDTIVEKHGLYKTKLGEITCFPAVVAVLNLEFQHVCSMNKSRELGYFGFADTRKSVKMWVERLREMKIIP